MTKFKIVSRRAVIFCLLCFLVLPVSVTSKYQTEFATLETKLEDQSASVVAWSPDGHYLAVGDALGIQLYTESLEFIRTLEQPSKQMKAIVWSPSSEYVASVGGHDLGATNRDEWRSNPIYVWEVETGQIVNIFEAHRAAVYSIAWSPDGSKIASGSWDRTVQIWYATTGEILHTFIINSELYSTEIMSVSWSPDNDLLATVVGLMGIYIWDTNTGKLSLTISYQDIPSSVVHWSPNGQLIAVNVEHILDAVTGEQRIHLGNCPSTEFFAWSPDSKFVSVIGWDNTVYICDIETDEVISTLEGNVRLNIEEPVRRPLYPISWYPNGSKLAAALGDGFVHIWHISNRTEEV